MTFDAVFAFVAIQISQVPMIRDFGWLLTVGIIAICISSIINPLAVLGIREFRSPDQGSGLQRGRARPPGGEAGSAPGVERAIVLVGARPSRCSSVGVVRRADS